MKRTKPDPDLAKWCAALAVQKAADEVPDGWLTAAELSEKLNKPLSTMGKMLLVAVRAGKCEVKKFRINCGVAVRPVPHYKLK